MEDPITPNVKDEIFKNLLKPFSERFQHPVLSWFIIISVYVHTGDILKLFLYLNDQYIPKGNETIIEEIGKNFSISSIIGIFLISILIGSIWPIFDAVFGKWIAFVQRKRENWIKKEIGKIYENNIKSLTDSLEGIVGIVEGDNQRKFLTEFDSNESQRILILRRLSTISVGDYVKYNFEDGLIYPYQSDRDGHLGLVVRTLPNNLCIVLTKGRIKNSDLNAKFPKNGKYRKVNEDWQIVSERDPYHIRKEGDYIAVDNTHINFNFAIKDRFNIP
ncbi:hypothetical protein V6Z05_15985 [Leptospira venezuelensis]|uniref:hypothetical protein n=1 Tax=Leptospira venezuelensis TaxID=1958811 RepID=UPI000A38AD90|nr:hypothetical protein [Leptospira venezuelensis]